MEDLVIESQKNILVTIVIPVYNVEKYLGKCLESVKKQTYQNIETIIVDDGSNDRSGSIAEEYAASDDRMKVVHKINQGLAEARNTGILCAKGEFLFFLDSDDYIDANCIECLLNASLRFNADISICRTARVKTDGTFMDEVIDSCETESLSSRNVIKNMYVSDHAMDYGIVTNKLYRKFLFDDLRFPKGRINEDEAIIVSLLYKCNAVAYVNKSMYFYLQRKDSIIGSLMHVNNVSRFTFYRERDSIFEEKQDTELMLLNANMVINMVYHEYAQYHKVINHEMLMNSKKEATYYLRKYRNKLKKKEIIKVLIVNYCPILCCILHR